MFDLGTLFASIIPMVLAITVHEAAHGYAAFKLGDSTAKSLGRLTLDPSKHIDPVGTILLPAVSFFLGGFFFGWAKPVPVDSRALKNPKRDMFWIALAGPASNLIMALLWAWVGKLSFGFTDSVLPASPTQEMFSNFLFEMARVGVVMNISLMAINLLPIPPLDGSRMVDRFLNARQSMAFYKFEQYGFYVLIAFAFTGILSVLMAPLTSLGFWVVRTFS